MSACPDCHSPLVPNAKFCTTCGTSLDSVAAHVVMAPSGARSAGPRLNRLGVILLMIGVAIYGSSAVSHFFGQIASCLGDGSNDGCGNAAPQNPHVLSAALFVIAATVAFLGHQWLAHSSTSSIESTSPSPAARRKKVFASIALLAVAGVVTVQIESHSLTHSTNQSAMAKNYVSAMAKILERADIPGLQGSVEQLDSGGQMFYGTAPVRSGDIASVCRSFLDALSRIESKNLPKVVETDTGQVTSCISQISVVIDAPIDGTMYPVGSFHVPGLYRPTNTGEYVEFWAVLSLDAGRGSNSTTPYPRGYLWSVSISQM